MVQRKIQSGKVKYKMDQGRVVIAMIVFLFVVGVIHIFVSNIAVQGMVVPELRNVINGPNGDNIPVVDKTFINTAFDNIIFYWNTIFYILYFVIILWATVMLIRGPREQQQYGGGY